MARVGDGAQMANTINQTGQNLLAFQMRRDKLKQQELENQIRKDASYADNKRWVEQDTYRREQDNIRQGEAADRTRREDERFKYQQDRDTYRDETARVRGERDYYAKEESDAADRAYKYDALAQKLRDGAEAKDIQPKAMNVEFEGQSLPVIYNPQTGSYERIKGEKKPMVSITEDMPGGGTARRQVTAEDYEQQKLTSRPPADKFKALSDALAADENFGATTRKNRAQASGPFAPPQNATTASQPQMIPNPDPTKYKSGQKIRQGGIEYIIQ